MIIWGILVLALLVLVHEIGHFIAARILKIPVEVFSIGFGPPIAEFNSAFTKYRISLIPLGGYVKLFGEEEVPENVDTKLKKLAFKNRSYFEKMFVVLAGPLANLIFAWIVLVLVHILGFPILTPTIGEVLKDTPAEKAGLKGGDIIVSIDNSEVDSWEKVAKYIQKNPNKTINIVVLRGKEKLTFSLQPKEETVQTIFGEKKRIGIIGIKPSGNFAIKRYPLTIALVEATKKFYDIVYITVKGIVKLIERVVPIESIGGPIMIVQMAKEQATQGGSYLLFFMSLISINLAILNLLPIPVLDGGHAFIFTVEAIIRKPLDEKVKETISYFGLFIILMIMIIALYNDITKLIAR
ncbi:MAG: RIP metalloprotease RseP [Thermosulfidibacteraceae bacterium]